MLAAMIKSVEDGVEDLGAKFGLGFDDDREWGWAHTFFRNFSQQGLD